MKYVVHIDLDNGLSVPDNQVDSVIDDYVQNAGDIIIGTESLLLAIRVRVRLGYINPEDLVFVDEDGDEYRIGRTAKMPHTFHKKFDSFMEQNLYALL